MAENEALNRKEKKKAKSKTRGQNGSLIWSDGTVSKWGSVDLDYGQNGGENNLEGILTDWGEEGVAVEETRQQAEKQPPRHRRGARVSEERAKREKQDGRDDANGKWKESRWERRGRFEGGRKGEKWTRGERGRGDVWADGRGKTAKRPASLIRLAKEPPHTPRFSLPFCLPLAESMLEELSHSSLSTHKSGGRKTEPWKSGTRIPLAQVGNLTVFYGRETPGITILDTFCNAYSCYSGLHPAHCLGLPTKQLYQA
ncbi:predicted protein [Histoplasma capsulatum var. duboisii H88]|uniref:Predicted protein n=2 Tax=Ajellomyces capsulatus TaxID=5037 RepID=F0UDU9_AJEC8|nr:predicted protein [Histoplasma capsulatum H143]EGC44522.1 predicted protein [Histoplasma capsulatum var. duboisii H88]